MNDSRQAPELIATKPSPAESFVHRGEQTLQETLDHMDKVNEDFKTGKGLPDVLKGYGPNKLKRHFVR